jgi:hypothetical protein
MPLWKKPLLVVSAILALVALAAPSAASAEAWHVNEEPLWGPGNPEHVSGSGSVEIRTVVTPGIRVECDVPAVAGQIWNSEEGAGSGELTEFQFGDSKTGKCDFSNDWYPPSQRWCTGTVTSNIASPWPILAVGGGEVELSNIELYLDGTECYWWFGSEPETLEGSLTGEWDSEQQTLNWSFDGELQPPGGGYAWVVNGEVGLNAENGWLSLK